MTRKNAYIMLKSVAPILLAGLAGAAFFGPGASILFAGLVYGYIVLHPTEYFK